LNIKFDSTVENVTYEIFNQTGSKHKQGILINNKKCFLLRNYLSKLLLNGTPLENN